ncbi:MAG: hypothetical protein H7832_00915 [Magnetococcus sp. DMHC-6]
MADPGIRWIKSKPSRIDEDKELNPIVIGEDTLTGQRYQETYDMVVLATGMEPNCTTEKVPAAGVEVDAYGFVVNAGGGIIGTGCSLSPVDVATSVQSGTAAALKAIQTAVKGG